MYVLQHLATACSFFGVLEPTLGRPSVTVSEQSHKTNFSTYQGLQHPAYCGLVRLFVFCSGLQTQARPLEELYGGVFLLMMSVAMVDHMRLQHPCKSQSGLPVSKGELSLW